MRIALTGADGFVGRAVARVLTARGDVVAGSDLSPNAGVATVDLRDEVAVLKWLDACRPNALIHAGAISGAMVTGDDPAVTHAVNVFGTRNVVSAMRHCEVGHLVFLSSIAVYAPRADRRPVIEYDALGSSTAYGKSKIEAEHIVRTAVTEQAIDGAWALRLSSVYGAGRTTPYLMSDLARFATSGQRASVTDGRTNMRQFIHIDDAVRAVVMALDRACDGFQPVNVTGGTYLSELQIAEAASLFLPGLTWEVVTEKEVGDGAFGPLDIKQANSLLGYTPSVSLEQGLEKTFIHLR